VKIKDEGTVPKPKPDDAPAKVADDKCKALKFIHDNWVASVKGKIDTRPWGSTEGSKEGSKAGSAKDSKESKESKGSSAETQKPVKRPAPPKNDSAPTVPTKKGKPPVSR
jgi:hypothetical protein